MDSMLVGRAAEREAIAAALRSLPERRGVVITVEGEPGIGKSRLLAHLAQTAATTCTVLEARASEFESDVPYALFTEALDWQPAEPADRHQTHRALREELERRARGRPLVLVLDDVHWADPASVDALAALIRRPPAAAVMLAIAARERQIPPHLAAALAGAMREDRVVGVTPGPLLALIHI